jgi:hypothetical protein
MSWVVFHSGETVGKRGSEHGIIMRDEEHPDAARITLERKCQTSPFAITCGIYGWMMHTRFFTTEAEALAAYSAMRTALSGIISTIPLESDPELDTKMKKVEHSIATFLEEHP